MGAARDEKIKRGPRWSAASSRVNDFGGSVESERWTHLWMCVGKGLSGFVGSANCYLAINLTVACSMIKFGIYGVERNSLGAMRYALYRTVRVINLNVITFILIN